MGWDTSSGMSPDPFGCTALQSRLVCAKCWTEPKIKNPEKVKKDGGTILVTVCCHGKEETRMLQMSELVFTQKFFQDEATE